MPRPEQMDKTTSFYFPSKDELDEWKSEAQKYGTSLNNYIYEMAQKGRLLERAAPRSDLSKEISELKEENRKLRDEIRLKSLVMEKYESELYRLRYAGFSEIDSEEAKEYDADLVELLRKGKVLGGHEILRALKIDPKDSDAARLVSNQLEELRRFGIVKETANGWKWIK